MRARSLFARGERSSRRRECPFTDRLFNALLGFVFLFMVAILFMNPIAKLGTANLKAEFIITLTWPNKAAV